MRAAALGLGCTVRGEALAQDTAAALATLGNAGNQQDGASSGSASLSADGTVVAFYSDATNLVVPIEANQDVDVFVRDLVARATTRVSVGIGGAEPNGVNAWPLLSSDGRWVFFTSTATNIVAGTPNTLQKVFAYDRTNGTYEIVSVANGGAPLNGWCCAFDPPDASNDGRFVAFASNSTNVGAGDAVLNYDVFLRDRLTLQTTKVSFMPGGAQWTDYCYMPTISDDGRWIAYYTAQSIHLYDALSHVTVALDRGSQPELSGDGRYLAFTSPDALIANDTNGQSDIYVRDLVLGTLERVSLAAGGGQTTKDSAGPAITPDGRYVAFQSTDPSIVLGDRGTSNNVFVFDRQAGTARLADARPDGSFGNVGSVSASLSADGQRVGFGSQSSNLIANDVNGRTDVFVSVRANSLANYCVSQTNSQGCTPSITSIGAPSTVPTVTFEVRASQVLDNVAGLLFYGLAPSNSPFNGGTMCVAAPRIRTALQSSGGTTVPSCTGSFRYDFGQRIQTGADPSLAAGTQVYCQYWSRDSAAAGTTNLTGGLTFVIDP